MAILDWLLLDLALDIVEVILVVLASLEHADIADAEIGRLRVTERLCAVNCVFYESDRLFLRLLLVHGGDPCDVYQAVQLELGIFESLANLVAVSEVLQRLLVLL